MTKNSLYGGPNKPYDLYLYAYWTGVYNVNKLRYFLWPANTRFQSICNQVSPCNGFERFTLHNGRDFWIPMNYGKSTRLRRNGRSRPPPNIVLRNILRSQNLHSCEGLFYFIKSNNYCFNVSHGNVRVCYQLNPIYFRETRFDLCRLITIQKQKDQLNITVKSAQNNIYPATTRHKKTLPRITLNTRQSKTRQSKTHQSKTRQSKTRQSKTHQSKTHQSKTHQSKTRQSKTHQSKTRHSKTHHPNSRPNIFIKKKW